MAEVAGRGDNFRAAPAGRGEALRIAPVLLDGFRVFLSRLEAALAPLVLGFGAAVSISKSSSGIGDVI